MGKKESNSSWPHLSGHHPAFKSKEEKSIKDLFRPGQLIAMECGQK